MTFDAANASRSRSSGPRRWARTWTRIAKNRVHFDLRAPGPMAGEVARLERLGATVTGRCPDLTVMADPEGNEFCVEPGPAASP